MSASLTGEASRLARLLAPPTECLCIRMLQKSTVCFYEVMAVKYYVKCVF